MPSEVPALGQGEVLVCFAHPEAFEGYALSRLVGCLDAEETARMERFRFERDRHIYLVAHALTRVLLARAWPVGQPQDLRFAQQAHGRPELVVPEGQLPGGPLRFNLSHTHGMVACGLCWEHDIGVDVEHVERRLDMESLAPSVLAPGELENLRGLPHGARRARFFEFWTLKEAYLKAVGQGLGLPLRSIDFQVAGPPPITAAGVRFGRGIDDVPERLRYRAWPLPPEHQLSVAVGGPRELPLRLAAVGRDALLAALEP